MLLNIIFLLLVPFWHSSSDLIVRGSKGEVIKINVKGNDTCNINERTLGGPNLSASLQIKNDKFKGCNCLFFLPEVGNYEYIVLYLDGSLRDDETLSVKDIDNQTVIFNQNSFKDECVYLRSPLALTYKSCSQEGELELNAIWASGKKCDKGSCYQCSMSSCYKHHSVADRKVYINRSFYMTDGFKESNCAGQISPGWSAFIVLFCVILVVIVALVVVYRKRKGKKSVLIVPTPSSLSTYPVITPADMQNRAANARDVSSSIFTTSGDMPIDSSNAYSRFENSLGSSVEIYK